MLHLSLVPQEWRGKCQYFLSHHCVLKDDSSTSKLKDVFNDSAATSSGYSLNEVPMSGPVI